MDEKLTPWFKRGVKPARIGVYEIAPFGKDDARLSHWNGQKWSFFSDDMEGVQVYVEHDTWHTTQFPWRGLASDPCKTDGGTQGGGKS